MEYRFSSASFWNIWFCSTSEPLFKTASQIPIDLPNPEFVRVKIFFSKITAYIIAKFDHLQPCTTFILKMISSPYCAVSEPNVYKHYKRLTRWNANRYYSLRITYLIFETFQTIFPTTSLIFTAVKVFIKRYIIKNEA